MAAPQGWEGGTRSWGGGEQGGEGKRSGESCEGEEPGLPRDCVQLNQESGY